MQSSKPREQTPADHRRGDQTFASEDVETVLEVVKDILSIDTNEREEVTKWLNDMHHAKERPERDIYSIKNTCHRLVGSKNPGMLLSLSMSDMVNVLRVKSVGFCIVCGK